MNLAMGSGCLCQGLGFALGDAVRGTRRNLAMGSGYACVRGSDLLWETLVQVHPDEF